MDGDVGGYSAGLLALGFAGTVLITTLLWVYMVSRGNIKAKDDPTPKLIGVIEKTNDNSSKLADQFILAGERQNEQAKANLAVSYAQEKALLDIGRGQAVLVDVAQKLNKGLDDTRADIRTFSSAQDAGREAALGRMTTAITASQETIIKAVSDLIADALKELKDALAPLRHKRAANTNVRKIAQRISTQIDELSKEIETYAKSHDTPPVSVVTTVGSLSVTDSAPSPILAPVSADQLDTPDPARGIHWAIDGDK